MAYRIAAVFSVVYLPHCSVYLQTYKANLQSQTHKLQQINDAVLVFEADNKKIKMAGFKQHISELSTSIKPTSHLLLR